MNKLIIFLLLLVISLGVSFQQFTIHKLHKQNGAAGKVLELNRKAIEVIIAQEEVIEEYERLIKDIRKGG